MSNGLNLAVVGATGMVGQEMGKVLEQRNFKLKNIKFFASKRSVGRRITFKRKGYAIEALEKNSFKGIDIALFSAGASVSKEFAKIAVKAGSLVIDNSSAFRMDKEVPLIIPEVNPEAIKGHNGIIANPNCSTVQMVVALKPLNDFAKIKRIVVTTFQAVSGTGSNAVSELKKQIQDYSDHRDVSANVYPHQIFLNVLPHIDVFLPDGSSKEEKKMVDETQKILGSKIKVSATAVRVPVFIGHSESINIETEKNLSPEKATSLLSAAQGVEVIDDLEKNQYPLPINSKGSDNCFVGRIRKDNSITNGLNIWVVADNLRKGAALNAVQIAELAVKKKLISN